MSPLFVHQRHHLIFQIVNFTEPFYVPPKVLVTAVRDKSNNSNRISAEIGPLSCWVEVRKDWFKILYEVQLTSFFLALFVVCFPCFVNSRVHSMWQEMLIAQKDEKKKKEEEEESANKEIDMWRRHTTFPCSCCCREQLEDIRDYYILKREQRQCWVLAAQGLVLRIRPGLRNYVICNF